LAVAINFELALSNYMECIEMQRTVNLNGTLLLPHPSFNEVEIPVEKLRSDRCLRIAAALRERFETCG
jgi:hypothetical protein